MTHSYWSNLTDKYKFSGNDAPISLIPLPEYCLITVAGTDSRTFLQGQCTIDINDLDAGFWRQGAHCNPKGRMVSSFVAAALNTSTIGLRLHTSIEDKALATLNKYAVFSKATLQTSSSHFIFALKGDAIALEKLITKDINTTLPEPGRCTVFNDGILLMRDPTLYEVWVDSNAAGSLFKKLSLSTSLTPIDSSQSAWTLLMIRAGICEVTADSQEQLIPQEMNYQLIDGVAFNKGCYTGQEIIARMHYRAELKKHMYAGIVDSDSTKPAPGPMSAITDSSGKKVGQCLLSTKNENNQIEFLALVNDDAKNNHTLHLHDNSDAIIEWQPLPYAIN